MECVPRCPREDDEDGSLARSTYCRLTGLYDARSSFHQRQKIFATRDYEGILRADTAYRTRTLPRPSAALKEEYF